MRERPGNRSDTDPHAEHDAHAHASSGYRNSLTKRGHDAITPGYGNTESHYDALATATYGHTFAHSHALPNTYATADNDALCHCFGKPHTDVRTRHMLRPGGAGHGAAVRFGPRPAKL